MFLNSEYLITRTIPVITKKILLELNNDKLPPIVWHFKLF